MGRGRHLVFEALDRASSPNEARLQPFDVINAAENLILDGGIVARIKRGVADDRNLAPNRIFRVHERKHERRMSVQTVDPQERHVPMRVDHDVGERRSGSSQTGLFHA